MRRLAKEAGPIDILVNNAAVVTVGPTAEQDVGSYDSAFDVNVRAPYFLTAHFAPQMAANGGGSIVNVSSTAASVGLPGMSVYSATKAALEALTRSWTAELAESKVRVNAVSPGPMTTTKAVDMMGPDVGGLGETTAMKRTSTPQEVAHVIVFLASDRSSYLTGATVAVDGGRGAI